MRVAGSRRYSYLSISSVSRLPLAHRLNSQLSYIAIVIDDIMNSLYRHWGLPLVLLHKVDTKYCLSLLFATVFDLSGKCLRYLWVARVSVFYHSPKPDYFY